ncbi:MAG TPA: hypothetical protein DCP90_06710 [Clostridiales bacterium]|nr:MAG: hypothetical protein A2Y22_00565 [Clostridiales bacterium GWD2_32_59]HAN10285.1 hypothetical protein [Clostridiales bacterium]
MKRLVYVIFISIFMTSCGGPNEYEQVHENIIKLDSYCYEMEFCVISNKNENMYKIRVTANAEDGYMVEILEPENIKRIVTRYNKDKTEQENTSIQDKITLVDTEKFDYNILMLSNFKKVYMQQDKIEINKQKDGTYKVEISIPNGNYYFNKQEIIFDGQDKQPIIMNVYNEDGQKTIEGKVCKDNQR